MVYHQIAGYDSLPPRGRGTAIAVEGACETMVYELMTKRDFCYILAFFP